jgi:hypothetical protein
MSLTTIHRRWFWQLAFIVSLAGCVAPVNSEAELTVAGNVVVAPPSGFCILQESRFVQGTAEFAAMLPCASALPLIGGGVKAVLTVTVGEDGTANGLDLTASGLTAYFESDEGRAALSRAGKAESVIVHEVRETNGAVVVRMTDQSARWPGMGWRAVAAMRGHLVTLTVRGNGAEALTEAQGQRLIDRFVGAMRRANRG